MKIESPAFQNNERIPSKFTCDGQNINPQLRFSEVPEEAKSLVLISDDPDAPMGTWVHWTVWNIPPETREIPEDSVPEGSVEGLTSFGKPGYGGPCPPSGTHRYFFKLFALNTRLDLPPETSAGELETAALNHAIEKAEFYGLYNRN
jgi:Raf kinase inhibitor-like YbhB/YbcL family protein